MLPVIDINAAPISSDALKSLQEKSASKARKVRNITTALGLVLILCIFAGAFLKPLPSFTNYIFMAIVVGYIGTHRWTGSLEETHDDMKPVSQDRSAQMLVYCQTDGASRRYHDAVLLQGRTFINAEYDAMQKYANERGNDGGMTILYNQFLVTEE